MPKSLEMRVFLIHLAAYVAVSAILIVLNLMQTPPEGAPRELWFQWPVIGWGIGVAAHGLAVFLRRQAKPGSRLADERIRGFLVHLFAYVAVNILLIVVDLVATPGVQWFWWPLLGWGAGLAAHGYGVWHATRQEPAPSSETPCKPDLETESPWPESSVTESPKTGVVAPPVEPETGTARPAPAEAKRAAATVQGAAAKAEEAEPAAPAREAPKAKGAAPKTAKRKSAQAKRPRKTANKRAPRKKPSSSPKSPRA